MKSKRILALGSLSLMLLLSACRPGGAEYVDDLDVVGTAYTKQYSFTDRKTYYMNDSIPEVASEDKSDPNGDGKPTYIKQSSANQITAQIAKNLASYGWTRVSKVSDADVSIMNAAMESTQIYYYYNYWYYGGYYPYYGWYYPGYYPPTYTTTKTGTLLMQMIDNKDINGSGRAPALWIGIVNGMMEGSSANQSSRIASAIDQAFKQSPILKR